MSRRKQVAEPVDTAVATANTEAVYAALERLGVSTDDPQDGGFPLWINDAAATKVTIPAATFVALARVAAAEPGAAAALADALAKWRRGGAA